MRRNRFHYQGLALCFSLFCMTSMPSQAQDIPTDVVCDNDIMDKIEEVIPSLLKVQPGKYGVSNLKRHISREIPKEATRKILEQQKKFGTPQENQPQSGEVLYEKCCKSTLIFGNYYDCGECDEMHTGVGTTAIALTEDGICMTNYHVMEDIIRKDSASLKGDSLFYVGTIDGKAYPITAVLGYSRIDDTAIFQVDTRGDKLACFPLGDAAKVGSHVNIISHPKHVLYYYTDGKVSKNSMFKEENMPEMYRMQVTAEFAVGSSGGPVFNDYGQLVGMVASTTGFYFEDDKKENLQMVVKTTIPIFRIKHLLGIK